MRAYGDGGGAYKLVKLSASTGGGGGGSSYELPVASASTLGGIKIGSGLSIDAGTGVLSTSFSAYSLPTASSSVLGGIKVGTSLSISSGVLNTTLPLPDTLESSTSTAISGYTLVTSSPSGFYGVKQTNYLGFTINDTALTLLQDGRVLMAGGYRNGAYTANTYIGTVSASGDKSAITWVASTALPSIRGGGTLNTLSDGRVIYACGGNNVGTAQTTVYIGTVSGDTISWVTSTDCPVARTGHVSCILSNGRLLLVSGYNTPSCYFGTVSGDAIAWVSAGNYPSGVACVNPAFSIIDGVAADTVASVGGSNSGNSSSNSYLGKISGNTITWYSAESLPFPLSSLSGISIFSKLVMLGGYRSGVNYLGILATCLITETKIYPESNYLKLAVAVSNPAAVKLANGRILCVGGNLVGGSQSDAVQTIYPKYIFTKN